MSLNLPSRPDQHPSELVKVMTTVVSPNEVVSPFSGLRAAVFLFRFWVHLPEQDSAMHVGDPTVELLEDQLGDHVRLDLGKGRGRVSVPREKRGLVFHGSSSSAGTIVAHLPPRWAHLLRHEKARRGSIHVSEMPLVRGDHVLFTGHVQRAEDDDPSTETSYRQNAGDRDLFFVARPDLGPVCLEERLPTF